MPHSTSSLALLLLLPVLISSRPLPFNVTPDRNDPPTDTTGQPWPLRTDPRNPEAPPRVIIPYHIPDGTPEATAQMMRDGVALRNRSATDHPERGPLSGEFREIQNHEIPQYPDHVTVYDSQNGSRAYKGHASAELKAQYPDKVMAMHLDSTNTPPAQRAAATAHETLHVGEMASHEHQRADAPVDAHPQNLRDPRHINDIMKTGANYAVAVTPHDPDSLSAYGGHAGARQGRATLTDSVTGQPLRDPTELSALDHEGINKVHANAITQEQRDRAVAEKRAGMNPQPSFNPPRYDGFVRPPPESSPEWDSDKHLPSTAHESNKFLTQARPTSTQQSTPSSPLTRTPSVQSQATSSTPSTRRTSVSSVESAHAPAMGSMPLAPQIAAGTMPKYSTVAATPIPKTAAPVAKATATTPAPVKPAAKPIEIKPHIV